MILSLICDPYLRQPIINRVMSRYDVTLIERFFLEGWICCTRINEPSLMIVTNDRSPVPDATKYDIICPPGIKYPDAIVVSTFEEIETLLRLKR